jgi:hypothetical protein
LSHNLANCVEAIQSQHFQVEYGNICACRDSAALADLSILGNYANLTKSIAKHRGRWNAARPPVKGFGVIGDFRAFGAPRHRRHIISRVTTDRLADWRNDRQPFHIDPVFESPSYAPLFSSVAVADGNETPKRRQSARKRKSGND